MKIRYEVFVETNRVGSRESDIIEIDVDDDATQEDIDKEIDEAAKEWMFNHIEYGYKPIT